MTDDAELERRANAPDADFISADELLAADDVAVTEGCGCVGCDIGLPVTKGRHQPRNTGAGSFPCDIALKLARVRKLCDQHDSGERVVWVWRIREALDA